MTPAAQLREQLELIWRDPKVRFAGHLVWWNTKVGYEAGEGLFYRKGRQMGVVRAKHKGYGTFTVRPGVYGMCSRMSRKIRDEPKLPLVVITDPCHCSQPHHLPVWHCPVHGEVVVPMD